MRPGYDARAIAAAVLTAAIIFPTGLAQPSQSDAPPRYIGIVIYDGFVTNEAIAPLVVLRKAAKRPQFESYRVVTVAARQGPVKSSNGLRVIPDTTFDSSPQLDVLIVPAGDDIGSRMQDSELIGFIQRQSREAQYVVGICSGVHLLGKADLLDGKRATTFPGGEEALQRAFPKAKIQRDQPIVVDGSLITVSGELVSYKASLVLLKEIAGKEFADEISKALFYDRLTPLE